MYSATSDIQNKLTISPMLFRGVGTAIVTPFDHFGQIDLPAFAELIEYQIAGGVDALVVLGTTGECPNLDYQERTVVINAAIGYVAGRVPVVVGTGTNSTRQSILYSKQAETLGADGQMIVGPAYNKPGQKGFVAHIDAILEDSNLPTIIYNVPGRTSFNILPDTILSLAERHSQIVGVKEASGDLAQVVDLLRSRREGLAVYSGDDELALPICSLGGDGVVSVLSNALPDLMSDMLDAILVNRIDEARDLHFRLVPAMRACFVESNPVPIKAALAEMDLISNRLRLPLVELEQENLDLVREQIVSLARDLVLA